jgi:murein DD-endopeptidase MepM/ murein hydrolase activator NlpD
MAGGLLLALVVTLGGCLQRRADGTRGTDSVTVGTAGRVDTVVRVDTFLVRDTLSALGDTIAATPSASSGTTQSTVPVASPSPPASTGATVPTPPAVGTVNPPPVTPEAMAALAARRISVPIAGIPAAKLPETFNESRGGGARKHEALDIMSPRNTPIHSVDDGSVIKLFTSKAGGLTVYAADPTGHFIYYYAHLDHYTPGLHEGQPLHRGDVIGYVGSTGDASPDAPHLHFAIALSNNVNEWWKGTAVDPTPVLQASAAAGTPVTH